MPRRRVFAASADIHRFSWMSRLKELAEMGTGDYPPLIRRRLMIVNLMAYLIAIFSLFYAILFTLYGIETYLSLVVANLILLAVALLTPLFHRVSDICAAMVIAGVEFVGLFFFVRALGHVSGARINYLVTAAIPFAIFGLSRLWLVITAIATGLILHLAVWFLYPSQNALITSHPALINNLYVSSVVTTGCIIAVIVLYVFSLADDARAEADALLSNMLPESIAERPKANPGELLADNVANASVMFADLVGFTPLARELGAEHTVSLLDEIISEFDVIAARHGVEKIKTIGDGYMAVSGVTVPLPDHEARLAGVIGADRFSYDVWGETVNLASRLENHRLSGHVHVSDEVNQALIERFHFEPRGRIEIMSVGRLETWFLHHPRIT